jgi:hypothetical protein
MLTAASGDAALYDQYLGHLHSAKTPQEYNLYLGALGLFPDPALTKRTFDLILGPDVKNQELYYLFAPLTNYSTQSTAWELFKSDYAAVLKKADGGMEGALPQVASIFCDAKLSEDAQQFFAEKHIAGSERTLRNAQDRVNACIQVRELQQQNLSEYLKR